MADTSTTIILAPPTDSEPATADPATTLATLPAPDGHPHLVLLTDTDTPAIVLAHRHSVVDLLLTDATTVTVPARTPATTITDPAQPTGLLRAAVTHFRTTLNDTQAAFDTAELQYRQVLDNIRAYAVDRHRAGDICRGGLDRFLTTFDMEPYLPPLRVRFTITGSYVVHDSTADFAEYDGTGLRVDVANISNLVRDSTDFDVSIDAVDAVDDADDRDLY